MQRVGMPEQLLHRLLQTQAVGHTACQSLHALRSIVSLQALVTDSAQWAAVGVNSRQGARNYASRSSARLDDPNRNFRRINHQYKPASHEPRPINWQSANSNNAKPKSDQGPVQRRSDLHPPLSTAQGTTNELLRIWNATQSPSVPSAHSDAGPRVQAPALDVPLAGVVGPLPTNAKERKGYLKQFNDQQREVLPGGVPSNYRPFVPPPRDAFRLVVNDRGKLPNRHTRAAAHGGTYRQVPNEGPRPSNLAGSYASYDSGEPYGRSGPTAPRLNRTDRDPNEKPEHVGYVRVRDRPGGTRKLHDTAILGGRLHVPRPYTQTHTNRQEPHSEAQQSAEKQLASPDLQVPYDSVNGKHAFGNSMPRPGFRDRVVSDREAPGRSVGGWSSSARINGWDQFAHRPGQPAPYERQQPQQPAAAAVGVPPPKPRPPPPPPKPRVDPKDIPIRLSDDVTVKELASMLGVSVGRLEELLLEAGDSVSSEEDLVKPDSAELAAMELGRMVVYSADVSRRDADAQPRPAVVTVMGHADHGKTSLLDALRKTTVAAGEAGGITQHMGAFTVRMPGSKETLTFLDTPGHAAFTAMRARGAAVTDLVVLVVAAEDGLMPQTREALAHARAAKCPIVVAITKCDLPNAQPDEVEQQLIAEGVDLDSQGGSVQLVHTAAPSGVGLKELEEALLLQAEMMELSASRSRIPEAVVVEAKMVKGQGAVATIIAKRGTLRPGQNFVVGCEWGKVRSLRVPGGKLVKQVLPGEPAEVTGLRGLPQPGDPLMGVDSEERAQRMSEARASRSEAYRLARRQASLSAQEAADVAKDQAAEEGEDALDRRVLSVVVKADVLGSVETIIDAVTRLSSDKVRVKVLFSGVGPVTQSDIQLAASSDAVVLAFNVRAPDHVVEQEAKQSAVRICSQRIIYRLLEEVGDLMVGSAANVDQEIVLGHASVLQVFSLKGSKGERGPTVAGCRVSDGNLRADMRYRIVRDGEVIHEDAYCDSLKRVKQVVDTVGKDAECGLMLKDFNDVQPGDEVICYTVENRPATTEEVLQQQAAEVGR